MISIINWPNGTTDGAERTWLCRRPFNLDIGVAPAVQVIPRGVVRLEARIDGIVTMSTRIDGVATLGTRIDGEAYVG